MIQTFGQFLIEAKLKEVAINRFPKIGWWLDNNVITFYHGTHEKNIPFIEKNGIVAPTSGPTANWVSLALEPNTGHGYAAMSGAGGESAFRAAGSKVISVPHEQRVTFIIKLPKKLVVERMAPERGSMDLTKDRLKKKELYEQLTKKGMSDSEYYALTEIRMPKVIPARYIAGYTYLRGKK